MNTNPTLSELIQTAINTVSRVEVILDRAEERERKLDALIEKFNAVFPDEDDEAETRLAPAFDLPESALPSIAASTPDIRVHELPTVTGEGPAVDLAMQLKNPSGPDRFAAVEDPTKRDLPMGTDWPPLPELPEGKTRWVNRGDFRNEKPQAAEGRHVRYFSEIDDAWVQTLTFSGALVHIEAVAEEPAPEPVAVDPVKPRLIPEVGAYYWMRGGPTARILETSDNGSFKGEVHFSNQWHPFYWHADGTPYGTGDPAWDLVELAPF